MGRSIIEPPAAGVGCAICWGSGKPFGAGPTPSVLTVAVEGIEKGTGWVSGDGEPPNGTYRLDQLQPCGWTVTVGATTVTLIYFSNQSTARVRIGVIIALAADLTDICQLAYENQLSPVGAKFINGTFSVSL